MVGVVALSMKRVSDILDSIRRGLRRPEVRRHPIQAITRRLAWRWHWKRQPDTPIVLKDWWRGLSIVLPHTSNSSLVFYRRHSDEGMVWLLQVLLSPGMTFLDIGAHIGEFTLVGAEMVGAGGKAVAVEPLPPCAETIRKNAALNRMNQVAVFTGALYDRDLGAAFASMDVFVHTGEHETFCQTIQEALASGVPVIAPDKGGPRDLVAPFRTGILLPVDDFEPGLSRSVDHLLVQRTRYSANARRSVVDRSWPRICDQLLEHYCAVRAPGALRVPSPFQRLEFDSRPA